MRSMINSLLDPVVNFGKVTVSTGYSNLDTVIVLAAGDGSKLPHTDTGGNFNLVWFNSSAYPDPADDPNVEIVRCTVRTGDVLTIIRSEEGTAASSKNAAGKTYKMILSPTKKTIDDIQTESQMAISTAIGIHAGYTTGVHGVTGSVLGTEDIGVASGIAGLDANGKVPTTQLPALAITDVYTVADQAAQLALNAATQEGDVAIRTDENKSYVRNAGVSGTMTDWSLLLTPTDAVLSVFGRTGAVAATSGDYTWAQIDKTTSSIGDITTRSHTLLTDIGTNTHATIDTAISNSTNHIAAVAPHSGHDTPSQRDTAIGTAIGTHAGLTTGVHGVTGSILGSEDVGIANGAASLDAGGKIPTTQLPGLALTNVYTVASQAAQLALNATTQEGDVAIRTDENKSYVHNAGVSGTMTDWSLLLTPTDVVTSVFGRTGVVAASNNDYTWGQINKATSSIGDITTRSHTLLTDIGTNSHTTIDTHISSSGTSVHGLGTMSTQASSNVAITGGSATGLTTVKVSNGLVIPVGTDKWAT